MQILAHSATSSEQVTKQPCYALSITRGKACEEANVYHGTAATSGNEVLCAGSEDSAAAKDFAPMPGIYCSDGIYMKVDHGVAVCQYYHAK